MIKLYQFAPAWDLPNASPFCLKLETYLRMTGLRFETVLNSDLRKAPKGKLPYIEDQGKVIADSNFVIAYLKSTYGDKLDGHLSAMDRAIALAMQRLIEENLYWCLVYSRWVDLMNWEETKAVYFNDLPSFLRGVVPAIARNKVLKNLDGHGMGRHNAAEVAQIGQADITALADFLADKPWFMGDHPTTLDATAYGILANILWVPMETPLKQHAETLPSLAAYCQRLKNQFFPELCSQKA